jgi:pimeloyl-ACP methyl ester carboxylesterase
LKNSAHPKSKIGRLCFNILTVRKSALFLLAIAAAYCPAQVITEGFVKPIGFRSVRGPFAQDPMQFDFVKGTWQTPTGANGWKAVKANAENRFEGQDFVGTYFSTTVQSDADKSAMLHALGHSLVYVNGVPRAGDPYAYGYLALPIRLKQGTNELVFVSGRGQLKAEIKTLDKPLHLRTEDPTLPDIVYGERDNLWAGLIVVNGTGEAAGNLQIKTSVDGKNGVTTSLPTINHETIRKVPIKLAIPSGSLPDKLTYKVQLLSKGKELDSQEISIRVRKQNETYRRTFISGIDGSVQYYAVNPAQKPHSQNGLIFSVHGASVEAQGQADAYSSKDWATLIAPTNRRPFGFDWEDWGRLDLLEVMKEAGKRYPHAADRVTLTGHSMGGHGTWINGALFPDKFAAIGPSAGWSTFWSYAGGWNPENPTPVEAMFRRAANPSDTMLFASNLKAAPIYVVHGDADDNVPVDQARNMRKYLQSIGVEPGYHEEPGAGHWWDKDGPGAECVDWPPLMNLLDNARIPPHPIALDFTTVNPAVSAKSHWVTIVQQERALLPSRVQVENPTQNVLKVKTENVKRLMLDDLSPQLWGLSMELDGQPVPLPKTFTNPIHLIKSAGKWVITKEPKDDEKTPVRGSGFKHAFTNNVILVYGTAGTPEENEWAYNKARYDAETFYYRGNGSFEVVSDKNLRSLRTADRNIVLYGNAESNSAWPSLLKDSPIQVHRNHANLGERTLSGTDLAVCFIQPRKGSKGALVGVVSGTGLEGMRLTNRMPYFLSGAGFPDWFAYRTDVLSDGSSKATAAGFFGNDWNLSTEDSAWR